ncbi:MAG: hypothetical protein M5U34_24705 [Chloroflexi bacterium]|nr:hypothetical protein [Chloroflexota bacterium]
MESGQFTVDGGGLVWPFAGDGRVVESAFVDLGGLGKRPFLYHLPAHQN